MRELGYTRPTLYRYLKSLKDIGLSDVDARRPAHARPARGRDGLPEPPRRPAGRCRHCRIWRASPRAHPCTALIVRWYGDKMLCVASQSSVPNPISSYPRGRPMPMGRGAIARSIMAFLPKPQQISLIDRYADDLRQVGVGATTEDVLAALKLVRRAGVAVAFGEVTPGAVGIAAADSRRRLPGGKPLRHDCGPAGARRTDRPDRRRGASGRRPDRRGGLRRILSKNLIYMRFLLTSSSADGMEEPEPGRPE